jgi:hypothetical protein
LKATDTAWIQSLAPREQSLLELLLGQAAVRAALVEGRVVELSACIDDRHGSLLPVSASVEINSTDDREAQAAIRGLSDGFGSLLIHNTLQFLTDPKAFLRLCFSKLPVGGVLIVIVPRQSRYRRELQLPSRHNRPYRRFYSPHTLMAVIEEAVDPCEFRIRVLSEVDAGYEYLAAPCRDANGGSDIVVAIERITRPVWRDELQT